MDSLLQRSLKTCKDTARYIERAADTLGSAWPGWLPLLTLCAEFRKQCEEFIAGRGLEMETIAFIGPKKAGKSTLLRLLIKDEKVRKEIKAGSCLGESTEKLTWIGPKHPKGMDTTIEQYVPCGSGSMPLLGVACTLADVPGENENDPRRARAAERALSLAVVKVLVLRSTDIRNVAIAALVRSAGCSLILPVITQIKSGDDRADLRSFSSYLAEVAPDAKVLQPLLSQDFDLNETPEDYPIRIGEELSEALGKALEGRSTHQLVFDLLEGNRQRFITRASEIASNHLRASLSAVTELNKRIDSALEDSALELLGDDRELGEGIRWSLRMNLVKHTPMWCFPWRPFLTVASIASGALDRLPLALVGSLPSLGTVIFQSVKNVRAGIGFQRATHEGMSARMAQNLSPILKREFAALEDALRADLGNGTAATSCADNVKLEIIGLGELQQLSTELIRKSIERHSPSSAAAYTVAVVGGLIFWGIFGWPLLALYRELTRGAYAVWDGNAAAATLFPQQTGSMIITSLFLAAIPVFLLLTIVLGWFARMRCVQACMNDLRTYHRGLCAEMIRDRNVFVRLSEPKLDACLSLLYPSFARSDD